MFCPCVYFVNFVCSSRVSTCTNHIPKMAKRFFYGEILTDHDGFAEEIRVTERVARSWERKKSLLVFYTCRSQPGGARLPSSYFTSVCVCVCYFRVCFLLFLITTTNSGMFYAINWKIKEKLTNYGIVVKESRKGCFKKRGDFVATFKRLLLFRVALKRAYRIGSYISVAENGNKEHPHCLILSICLFTYYWINLFQVYIFYIFLQITSRFIFVFVFSFLRGGVELAICPNV